MQFRDERRTAVVICTGASAGRIDLEPAKRYARISVNDGYILDPGADALYACDPRWWKFHGPAVRATFAGEKWAPDAQSCKAFALNHIELERRPGLSKRPGVIYTGGLIGNSGAQAINLAYLFGARRIVLIGMDMGGSHFFGAHPKDLGPTDSNHVGMVRAMSQMASELYAERVEVINCSDVRNINYWPSGGKIPTD